MKFKFFASVLFLMFLLASFAPSVLAANNRFVTLVYPVRGRQLWTGPLEKIDATLVNLRQKGLSSTWLFQYDALVDNELISKIKNDCRRCEFGLFLEVSENLATNADVSYTIGQGHWYRPDKIFLSGYSLHNRQKLIKEQFEQYKKIFGRYPVSVGAWYVDPFSLKYIVDQYGVTSYVSVADQFDTDGQRYWGKPWGVPFYPQKYSTLVPANSLENKLDIVQIQWAQRHPTDSYGKGPHFSQFSLQANDYINNGKNTDYFKSLIDQYVFNNQNPFGQITVGLEAGQELFSFESEHVKQIDYIKNISDEGKVKVLTMSQFSAWYKQSFPKLSPSMVISDEKTAWVSSPCYRLGYQLINSHPHVIDFRIYQSPTVSPDLLSSDQKPFLDRQTKPLIDKISLNNELRVFGWSTGMTDTSVNLGNKEISIDSCGDDRGIDSSAWAISQKLWLEKITSHFSIFKFSNINGADIMGIQTSKTSLFGFWSGRGVGFYNFPFQTLSKFRDLSQLWDN